MLCNFQELSFSANLTQLNIIINFQWNPKALKRMAAFFWTFGVPQDAFCLRNASQTLQHHRIPKQYSHMITLLSVPTQTYKYKLRICIENCEWMQPQMAVLAQANDQIKEGQSSKSNVPEQLAEPINFRKLCGYQRMTSCCRQGFPRAAKICQLAQQLSARTHLNKNKPFTGTASKT